MPGIIRAADFSLAPFRATAFLKRANSKPSLRRIVIARLVQSLNRELDWELPSMLLTWLLASADVSDLTPHFGRIREWLKSHPDNSNVRTRFLGFVERLPKGGPIDLSEVVTTYAEWLKLHPTDTQVRSNFSAFLRSLHRDDGRITEAIREGTSEMTRWLRDVALPSLHDRTDQSLIEAVCNGMENVAEHATTETALEILGGAVEMLEDVALTDRTAPLVEELTNLYHRIMRVAPLEKLNRIRAAILEWCDTNPSASGCSPWLPLPS